MKLRQPLTHVAEWWVLPPLRLGWLVLHLITPRNGSLQSLWQSRLRTISRIFHLGQQLAHYLRGHFKGRGGNDHLVDLVNFSSSISPKCLISSEKMIPKPQLPRCIFEYIQFLPQFIGSALAQNVIDSWTSWRLTIAIVGF